MSRWISELAALAAKREPAVLVTVADVRGSAPREPGARMIVTATETIGTIGGGRLEYECARVAWSYLQDRERPSLRRFPLGAAFGQCCGGVVDVLFQPLAGMDWLPELADRYRHRRNSWLCTSLDDEPSTVVCDEHAIGGPLPAVVAKQLPAAIFHGQGVARVDQWLVERIDGKATTVAIFGAGHVGSAIVHALAPLEHDLRWIDSRRNLFASVPPGVTALESANPAAEVAAMPAASVYLVMTHSHALDYDICTRILARGDAAYAGLIGSLTKRRRFEKRFRAEGLTDAQISRLVCPIGVAGVASKQPAAIAIAVAADILRTLEQPQPAAQPLRGNVHPLSSRR